VTKRWAIIITVIVVVLGTINFYIGLRGWQWGQAAAPFPLNAWAYWIPFGTISFSFLLARFVRQVFRHPVTNVLSVVGGYWLAILLYLLPILLAVDAARVLNRWLGVVPQTRTTVSVVGTTIVLLVGIALLYGSWRARNPVVVRYNVAIPKSGGKHEALHVVLVSDTHLGAINQMPRLRHMVEMVNGLEPDLVLIAGDLIDEDIDPFVEQNMAAELRKLQPRLGTYAVLGNHDHPAGPVAELRRQFEQAGVRLLVDEWVSVDDSFYVIGRDDLSGRFHTGRARQPLDKLLEQVDPSLPLILMDHQPHRLEEAQAAGIDLQVSGHTHRGQMFPNNYLTGRIFELDWGYLRKGATQVIVSLGFGTWGPPVRIGNRPEVVSIRVRFAG
jgi:uncharacterized protein